MSYSDDENGQENIAATLARVLPKAEVLIAQGPLNDIVHVAVPLGFKIESVDAEKLLPHPRRTKAQALFNDIDSFIDYVNRHAIDGTTVWCAFNPKTFSLSFTAVIDEHAKNTAGWREHAATFMPVMSTEWTTWTMANGAAMEQLQFAEFLEANEQDIAAVEGMPTSLQMHALATEFVARQDLSIKSVVRTQNGGVHLNFVNDADAGTTEAMRVFEKFSIGIPVFWTPPEAGAVQSPVIGYRLDARLKYKFTSGKVKFHFELIRADRVHQRAAVELIEIIRARLIGDGSAPVPLLLGNCK